VVARKSSSSLIWRVLSTDIAAKRIGFPKSFWLLIEKDELLMAKN
jgi:hypothetical protein